MPHFRTIFVFFLLVLFFAPAHADPVGYNQINNHYTIYLPEGDRGSLYLNKDHTFMIIPALDNIEYVHNCWGKWFFSEPRQTLRFRYADKCRVLNGSYNVSFSRKKLHLKNEEREFILYPFVSSHF